MLKNKEKINEQIQSKFVRLIGDNIISDVYDIEQARKIAVEFDLDLVEINNNVNPPIVKVIDYSKYKYEESIKAKERKKKQKESKQLLKEIRFSPNTDDHDFKFKIKHARNFLENGDLVKATVMFKGREIMFKDKGELILMKFADELNDIGIPDNLNLKIDGKKMVMIINPKKNK